MKNYRTLFCTALLILVSAGWALGQSKHFAGVWKNDVSSVRYEIALDGDQVKIAAIDDSDGEVLEVSDIKVAGKKAINFTLHTPSTDWWVHPTFKLVGKKQMMSELNNANGDILAYKKQ